MLKHFAPISRCDPDSPFAYVEPADEYTDLAAPVIGSLDAFKLPERLRALDDLDLVPRRGLADWDDGDAESVD